jgi:hypothetical protein
MLAMLHTIRVVVAEIARARDVGAIKAVVAVVTIAMSEQAVAMKAAILCTLVNVVHPHVVHCFGGHFHS